jgi:hypothetical protein
LAFASLKEKPLVEKRGKGSKIQSLSPKRREEWK